MLRTDVQPYCMLEGAMRTSLLLFLLPPLFLKHLLSFYCLVSSADHSISPL
jgi:hypothetical protein